MLWGLNRAERLPCFIQYLGKYFQVRRHLDKHTNTFGNSKKYILKSGQIHLEVGQINRQMSKHPCQDFIPVSQAATFQLSHNLRPHLKTKAYEERCSYEAFIKPSYSHKCFRSLQKGFPRTQLGLIAL